MQTIYINLAIMPMHLDQSVFDRLRTEIFASYFMAKRQGPVKTVKTTDFNLVIP